MVATLDKRGSGRTSRMLMEAEKLANEGYAVYIIAGSFLEAKRLRRLIVTDEIKVEPIDCPSFCWESFSLRGAHPNCVALVDHYAIECKFGKILDMWTKYDN